MKYLGLFFISSLFTLNAFSNDLCQPLAITDLTEDHVLELIDQEFDFTQVCEDGYEFLSLIDIYGSEDVRLLLLTNRRLRKASLIQIVRSDNTNAEKIRRISRIIAAEELDFSFNSQDENGLTSLMWSARIGNYKLTEFLIDKGLAKDINAEDLNGNTAIVWAAKNGHRDLVRLLMSRGANFDPEHVSQLLDLYDVVNQS